MALDETAEARISRTAGEVAAYMFDPANDPTWISGISEAEPLGPMPIDVGSRVRRRASFLGRRIDYVMEVVAMDPGRRLAMHAVEAPMPMDVTYEVEPAHGGAVARVRVQGDAGGLYRLAGPLISAQVGRSIGSDVERLRELLEADAPSWPRGAGPRAARIAARSTAPPERRSDVPPVLVRPRSASCIECWAPGRLAPSWLRSSRRDS